jgi:hypothetical protein
MRYIEFKHLIEDELGKHPEGFTWGELKARLDLPYTRPCQTWITRLEQEIGLKRSREDQRAYTWRLPAEGSSSRRA